MALIKKSVTPVDHLEAELRRLDEEIDRSKVAPQRENPAAKIYEARLQNDRKELVRRLELVRKSIQ